MLLTEHTIYGCNICGKEAYPSDLEIAWPDDHSLIWTRTDYPRYFVEYTCACGAQAHNIEFVIADGVLKARTS